MHREENSIRRRIIRSLFVIAFMLSTVLLTTQVMAAPAIQASNKKIVLKKSKKKKIKITLNDNQIQGLTITIKDGSVVGTSWSGNWKRDESGRAFIYIEFKGEKNGNTKVTIKDKNSSKKAVIKVTVKGFPTATERLKKFVLSDSDESEEYAGKMYKMNSLSFDPSFLNVGYCKQDGTFVFTYADFTKGTYTKENKYVTMIYDPKNPKQTIVVVEEHGTDISENEYSYSVSGVVNALKYKEGDLFPYTVTENTYYDYFEASMKHYYSVEEKEMDDETISTYVKYTFAGAMIDFDNALKKQNMSWKELGFKSF